MPKGYHTMMIYLYDVEVMGRKTIKPAFSVFYTLIKDKTWVFNQLECVHGPI